MGKGGARGGASLHPLVGGGAAAARRGGSAAPKPHAVGPANGSGRPRRDGRHARRSSPKASEDDYNPKGRWWGLKGSVPRARGTPHNAEKSRAGKECASTRSSGWRP